MIIAIPALYALLAIVPIWIVARIATRFLDRRSRESIRCRKCWYDLRGNVTNKCPECGADIHNTGAWWPGQPNRRKWINRLCLWMAICTIHTTYICNWYEENSTTIPGTVDIRAMVDKPKNIGVMAFIYVHSVKLPLIPASKFFVEDISFIVKITRGVEYSLRGNGDPLVVVYDSPRTLTPGTSITVSTLEQTVSKAIPQPPPQGFSDALTLVSISVERLVRNGKLTLDLQDAEQAIYIIHDELGSPQAYELIIEADTGVGGIGQVPAWTKWLPTVPISIIWLAGAYYITRYMRKRGVVWTLPDATTNS